MAQELGVVHGVVHGAYCIETSSYYYYLWLPAEYRGRLVITCCIVHVYTKHAFGPCSLNMNEVCAYERCMVRMCPLTWLKEAFKTPSMPHTVFCTIALSSMHEAVERFEHTPFDTEWPYLTSFRSASPLHTSEY